MAKLEQGVNDLYTWCLNNGIRGTQILIEWTGLDENNQPISIDSVSYGSSKKVKWRCKQGHEWITQIVSRTSNKTCCPYCTGRLVNTENSLKTWCLDNGQFGQKLLKEWTGLDENNQPVSMDNVTRTSNKKVKWRCKQGHEWITQIVSRTSNKTCCPYCSGLSVTPENSLKTWCILNGEWGQQLINEWTGLDENNQPISMNNVARASNKKVKWRCKQGHEWIAQIVSRTKVKTGCPYCSGRRK